MLTLAIYAFVSLLLVWALVRRPQLIVIVLAGAFGLSVFAADIAHGDALRSILMGIDGLITIAMWLLWVRYDSERAALVAAFAFLKICFGIAAATTAMPHLAWASGNNALFIVQVLIAGGFTDGIIAWLGRGYSRLVPRVHRVLGHVEKAE